MPPDGLREAEVTENIGGTTTVNSDIRVRVWAVQIPQEGTYDVKAKGNVNGYISPRLAFGHDSSSRLAAVGLRRSLRLRRCCDLFAALIWSARAGKKARPSNRTSRWRPTSRHGQSRRRRHAAASYTPTDQGVRLEQIRQLAALRDSGALTEDEYDGREAPHPRRTS